MEDKWGLPHLRAGAKNTSIYSRGNQRGHGETIRNKIQECCPETQWIICSCLHFWVCSSTNSFGGEGQHKWPKKVEMTKYEFKALFDKIKALQIYCFSVFL